MNHFEYVTAKEAKPYRNAIIEMTKELQNLIREYFTFQFHFIGSSSRNMITYDVKSNVGFDFDINYVINDENQNYCPDEIHRKVFNGLKQIYMRYGFNRIEESTRVITLKKVDVWSSKVLHSCDIALVYDYENKGRYHQEYIRFNKQKTNIKKDDSLQNIDDYNEKYNIVVCNPPFGSKIVETRTDVLKNFELAYEWEIKNGKYEKTDKLLKKQETGILFVEACVRECKKNGRIAIILPNGYLGNRSDKFAIVRQWVLKHTKIAAIVSLPRFTFKSSGADVSASVVFLEKKENKEIGFNDKYSFAVEMIEKVGWDAGNKKAAPLYVRAKED